MRKTRSLAASGEIDKNAPIEQSWASASRSASPRLVQKVEQAREYILCYAKAGRAWWAGYSAVGWQAAQSKFLPRMEWRTRWAQLFPQLIAELEPELLPPLRRAFNRGGATSISGLIYSLDSQAAFTGPSAATNLITLINVLNPQHSQVPAVIALNAAIVEYFPQSADQVTANPLPWAPATLPKGVPQLQMRLVDFFDSSPDQMSEVVFRLANDRWYDVAVKLSTHKKQDGTKESYATPITGTWIGKIQTKSKPDQPAEFVKQFCGLNGSTVEAFARGLYEAGLQLLANDIRKAARELASRIPPAEEPAAAQSMPYLVSALATTPYLIGVSITNVNSARGEALGEVELLSNSTYHVYVFAKLSNGTFSLRMVHANHAAFISNGNTKPRPHISIWSSTWAVSQLQLSPPVEALFAIATSAKVQNWTPDYRQPDGTLHFSQLPTIQDSCASPSWGIGTASLVACS